MLGARHRVGTPERMSPTHAIRHSFDPIDKRDDERVEISAGIQASLAGRYASALFDLAVDDGSVTAVESDLDRMDAALAELNDLSALIGNLQVSRSAAAAAMDGVAATLDLTPLTRKFIGVLAANRRLGKLPAMIAAFRTIAAAQRGEVTATVSSAHPLTEDQLTALKNKLTAREGRTVKLTADVDPDLLGGMVVTIGSRRIDGSIRSRLNSLATAMKADGNAAVGPSPKSTPNNAESKV